MTDAHSPRPPPGLSAEEAADRRCCKANSHSLRHRTAACYLFGLVAPAISAHISPGAHIEYVDELLEAAGDPQDPLERMMLEQVLMAHHAIGRLHLQAAQTIKPEVAKVYLDGVARLLGEFRRSVLAIQK